MTKKSKNNLLLYCSTTMAALAYADLCQPSTSSSATSAEDINLAKPAKQCPDFKDGPEQSACCPSQINAGAFFCCTEAHKAELEAQLAAEARRRFISNHVPELILASLALLVALILFCSFLCRRTRFCPWLHRRKTGGDHRRSSLGTGSLESADFLGSLRHTQLHHHRHHRQPPLMPRRNPFPTVLQQQHPQYARSLQHRQMAHQCPQSQQAKPIIPDAPPPYEEFVTVPPPPPPEAPLPNLADDEAEEQRQNRINTQRERMEGGGES